MKKIYIIMPVIVLIGVIWVIYKSQELSRQYKHQVLQGLSQYSVSDSEILTKEDISHLPEAVQKYLRYVGVVGKQKVENFRVVFEGQFKTDPEKEWAEFTSEQYNFIANPMRFYYMKLNMGFSPVMGLHSYKDVKARMVIRPLGLFTVVDAKGKEMNRAETVTVFNDMCLIAPATLIDDRITWETIDPLTVKATFNNNGVKISAKMYFNEEGKLINFISNDRSLTNGDGNFVNAPWSTPIKSYQKINDLNLPSYGETIWNLPEGDYTYAKINIMKVKYNVKNFK